MAIGSTPEIGTHFDRWGNMTEEQQQTWFQHMRTVYGPNLYGGYATVHYADRKRYAQLEM